MNETSTVPMRNANWEKHQARQKAETDYHVVQNKAFRIALDNVLQEIKIASTMAPLIPVETEGSVTKYTRSSRNRSLAITHLEDAIMRLGMDMKDLNEPTPYPNSYNVGNAVVDKTADGLKL